MASKLLEDELTSEGDVVDLLLEDAIDADGNDIAMLYAIAEIARIDPESAIKLLKASIQSLNNPKKPIRYTLRYGGLGNASEKLSEVAIAMSRGSLENMNELKSTDPELAAQFRERIVHVDTVAKKLSMREGFNALDLFADKNLNNPTVVKNLRASCANMLEKVQEIKTQSDKVAAEDAIERVRGAFGKIATNVGLQLNPLTRTVMAAAMVPKSTADIIQQKRSEGRGGLLSFGQATSASFPRAKNERWPAYETGGQIPPNRALEVPISSSALTHSTHGGGIVKCGVCYGTIKTGLPIDTCNGCHATYHSSCAERVVNIDGCPVCTVKEKHRHSDIKSFGKREMSLYENIYSYMSILDNFGASAGINAEDFKRDFEWVQRHHSDGKQSTVKKMTALHKTLKSAFNSVSPSKISKLDYSNVLNQFNEEVRFLEQKLSKGSRFRRWWFSRRWGFGKEKNPVIDKEKGMQYIDHLEKDLAYLIGQRDEMKKAFEHNPSDIFRMIGSAMAIADDLKEVYYTNVIKQNIVQAVAIASVATVIGVTAIPALYNSLNNGSKPSGKPVPANPNNNTTSNATPNGATVWKAPSVNPNFQTAYPILYNTAKAIFDADDVFTGKVNVSVQGNNVVFMNNGSHEVFLVADTAIGNYQIKVTGQDYGLDAGVDVWVNISAPDVPDKSVSLEVILNNTGKVTKDAKYSIVANPPAYDMNNRDQFIRSGKFYLMDNETKEVLGETDLYTKDGKINTQGAMKLASTLLAGKELIGQVNITTATGLVSMSSSTVSPDVPYQISDSWVKNGSFGFKYDNPDAGLEASIQYTLINKATGNKTVSDLLIPINGTNMIPNVAKGLLKGEYDFYAVDLNTGQVIAEGPVFQKGLPPEASGLVNSSVVHDFLKDGSYKWTQIANLINEPGDVTHYKWVFDINGEQKETVGSTTDKTVTLEEMITAADVKAASGVLPISGSLTVWDSDGINEYYFNLNIESMAHAFPHVKEFDARAYVDVVTSTETIRVKGKIIGDNLTSYVTLTDHQGKEYNKSLNLNNSGDFSENITKAELINLDLSKPLSLKVGAIGDHGINTDKNTDLETRTELLVLDGTIDRVVDTNYGILSHGINGSMPDANIINDTLEQQKNTLQSNFVAGDIKKYSDKIWGILNSYSAYSNDDANTDEAYRFGLQFEELFKKAVEKGYVNQGNPEYDNLHFCIIKGKNATGDNTLGVVIRSDFSNTSKTFNSNTYIDIKTGYANPLEHMRSLGYRFAWDVDSEISPLEKQIALWQLISSVDNTKLELFAGVHNPQLEHSTAAGDHVFSIIDGNNLDIRLTEDNAIELGIIFTTIKDLLPKLTGDQKLFVDYESGAYSIKLTTLNQN